MTSSSAFIIGKGRSAGALTVVAGLLSAVLAGCASEKVPEPLAPVVVPPHAAAPPPVALSGRVLEAASIYRLYVKRAAQITPSFTNGPQIEASLALGESYEPQQLARGVVAYGALVALQDPSFVASVRTFAVDPDGRRSLAQKIIADPNYVAALPGAPSAAGLVITSLNADSAKVRSAGELVKQFAYDVQHQAWSKRDIVDGPGRLARAKAASAAPMTPIPDDVEQLKGAVTAGDDKVASKGLLVTGAASAPPYTSVVSRALAVAALAALGEGGEEHEGQLDALLSETNGGFCLNMSKLNLYQCLAVARPWYEDAFCLGQHVLIDTGQCIAKDAGAAKPVQLATTPPGVASPTVQSAAP